MTIDLGLRYSYASIIHLTSLTIVVREFDLDIIDGKVISGLR